MLDLTIRGACPHRNICRWVERVWLRTGWLAASVLPDSTRKTFKFTDSGASPVRSPPGIVADAVRLDATAAGQCESALSAAAV